MMYLSAKHTIDGLQFVSSMFMKYNNSATFPDHGQYRFFDATEAYDEVH